MTESSPTFWLPAVPHPPVEEDTGADGDDLAALRAERRRSVAAEQLAEGCRRLLDTITAGVDEGILILLSDGRIEGVNQVAAAILGRSPNALLGLRFHPLVHERPGGFICDGRACPLALTATDQPFQAIDEAHVLRADGTHVAVSIQVDFVAGLERRRAVVFIRDRSEVVRLERELRQRGAVDPLTGLPNSTHFRQRLSEAALRAAESGRRVAVLFVDIDRFGVVNSSLGHAAGDTILREFGQRVAARLGTDRLIARFGGDQFTALLEEIRRPAEAARIAERLIEELRAPFRLDGHEVFLTASVGVAVSPPAGGHPADLLREADGALRQARTAGRGRLAVARATPAAPPPPRLDLESDLWRALQRGELRLEYQPIVELTGGSVVEVEALARWDHPRHGTVMPATFVPLAEEMGLMVSLGRWVLEEACRQAHSWRTADDSTDAPTVSVNLSAHEFQHPDLVRQVSGVLRRTGLDPRFLTLEITEGILMNRTPELVKTLRALKRLGARLAIDDFGTGYSSLSYLRQFPVDVVKIDKSLIQPLRADRKSSAIVRAVVNLAHDLDMTVTAEGIETAAQLARLRELGCDHGQGFYFAPSLTTADAANRLTGGSTVTFPRRSSGQRLRPPRRQLPIVRRTTS